MSDLQTYTCEVCDKQFAAHPDANAAQNQTCSPQCETGPQSRASGAALSALVGKLKAAFN